MLEINSYSSSLASISKRVPVGLAEAENAVRQKALQSNPVADSKDASQLNSASSLSPNALPIEKVQKQSLNSIPNQRIADLSGANLQNRMASESDPDSPDQQQLQDKIDQVVNQLKARDREVRAHEQAHLSVAGQYATGMSFSYQTGPDGKRYAIGGEVGIDTSPVSGDPQATIQKAMIIQSAAMAPAQPSSQDYRVAASAAQMMVEARAELAKQGREENSGALEVSQNTTNSEPNEPNEMGLSNQQDEVNQIPERMAFEARLQMPTGQEMVADLVNPS